MAVVALGSYARRELCPGSDVDVLLLHDGRRDIASLADALWYPLWDAGFVLGHATRTPKECVRLADRDLDTLTALLDARVVAGAPDLTTGVVQRVRDLAQRRAEPLVARLAADAVARTQRPGPIAELLEPDLKEGAGGLRDVQALHWAGWTRGAPGGVEALLRDGYLHTEDPVGLAAAHDTLLELRVALHRVTGRRADVLALQDQDAVAEALGDEDADALVRRLALASRRVAWIAGETWDRLVTGSRGPSGRSGRADRELAPGVVLRDGRVALQADAAVDGATVLRAAEAAARLDAPVDRATLERLRAMPAVTWDADERNALIALLRTGRGAIPVIEALDHVGAWTPFLPEWDHVRSRPQRNAYHRWTVDRHLLEVVAECAALLDADGHAGELGASLSRPDVLLLAALLHDIAKGRPGDHSDVGAAAAAEVAARIGLDDDGTARLVWLVRHHLLMADTATRRDLADPATVRRFAAAVGDVETLSLLALLTTGDSRATGPSAWSASKAALIRELLARTRGALTADAPAVPETDPLVTYEALLRSGRVEVRFEHGDDDAAGDWRVVVVAPDHAGLLGTVAGALTLVGFDIATAGAWTHPDGMALELFSGHDRFDRLLTEDGRVAATRLIEDALAGGVPVDERLRERRDRYARGPSGRAPEVRVEADASDTATVVEVHADDEVGLLAAITTVFAAEGLDVTVARATTIGDRAVDVFYVRERGARIEDPARLAALREAVLARLADGRADGPPAGVA